MASSAGAVEILERETLLGGRYLVDALIGVGGMANVYRVLDRTQNNKAIALKLLHQELLDHDDYVQRFIREVRILSQIQHPNVIEVFDIHYEFGMVFYSMELLEGSTLEDYLLEQNFDLHFTVDIIEQLCHGLQSVHEAGIVHRDIKPANIFITEDGFLKLLDFGTARGKKSEITQQGEMLGSVCYLAPEAWSETEPSIALDYYSLGIVLYELLTGDVPFDGGTPIQVMRGHLEGIVTNPRRKNRRIPRWLAALNLRLLARNPAERLTSAAEILACLDDIRNKRNSSAYFRTLESLGLS